MPDLDAAARRVAEGANALRATQRLAALEPEPRLQRAATAFAAYMAAGDRYGHEADGRTPLQRAQAQGYRHCAIAENIAMQYDTTGFSVAKLADRLVTGWSNSPPHRQNLLDATFTQTGVALARSAASGRYYAVQLFGRPETLQLRFRVANRSDRALRYEVDGDAHTLRPNETITHTVCSAGTLTLPGETDATRVQARDGLRYVITREGDRWQIDEDR